MKDFVTIQSDKSNLSKKEKEEYDKIIDNENISRNGTGEWSNIDT